MSGVYSMDLSSPDRPIHSFEAGRPGIWGRAGVAMSRSGTVFAETGDGDFNPDKGQYADSFLALSAKDLKLTDRYTPANREWLTRKDLDMGNMSPVVFRYRGDEYLAGAGKEGRIFLLNTASLGGESHREPMYRSPLLTNEDSNHAAHGFWGSFATWEDSASTRWLLRAGVGPSASRGAGFSDYQWRRSARQRHGFQSRDSSRLSDAIASLDLARFECS